jgi:alkylation response protein AidB-like acyl-CoA dehydrogenase
VDFGFSDEQTLLKESIDRWAGDTYPSLSEVRAARREPAGFPAQTWRALADLGMLGLPFAEDDGGFGCGAIETMIVMEAIGRSLAPEPFLTTVVVAGTVLKRAATAAQRAALLPGIIAGETRIALAHGERQARFDLNDVATSATRVAGGWRIDGEKTVVFNADSADWLIVSARTSGSRRDVDGITLFLVSAKAVGVSIVVHRTQDDGRSADITLDGVAVGDEAVLGPVGAGLAVVERATEAGIAAIAAEAVGIMQALQDLTVRYLRTRSQFGTAIGQFQALQHKAVDMLVALEQAGSMALYAAMMVEAEDAEERRVALSAVKVEVNRSARFVGQTAVQLHGGIGMTMDYLGAHYFRRLAMIEITLGNTAHHLRRVTEAGGLVAVD